MADKHVLSNAEPSTTLPAQVVVGRPQEQLEVQEQDTIEDEPEYPTGPKLWLTMAAMLIAVFLGGLDVTIVAVSVPSITNEFKTVADIGWYNSAYMLTTSATMFFFGKAYGLYDVKKMFLAAIVVFWLGSVVCTFAPSSTVFVFGRALAGLGVGWKSGGVLNLMNLMFPLQKRPTALGIIGFTQSCAMTAAPIVGGGLIQKFGWRACYGLNIPLLALAFLFSAYAMQKPKETPENLLPWKEKVRRLDLFSTLLCIPAIVCLLMALQWGGIRYGWQDARIIVLMVLGFVLLTAFAYLQWRFPETASIPPRIIKQRSVLAAMWFGFCVNGVLAVTENYMAIYYQGVRGLSPTKAGVLGVPMIVGLAAANVVAGLGVTWVGYYTPFMIFTSLVSPIASGLLTTLDLDSQVGKGAGLLGLLGFALGVGFIAPLTAISTVLKPSDVSIGTACTGFGGGMGSALFSSAAALLFQNRLSDEVSTYAPGTNITTIEKAGLSDIRNAIGADSLKRVLIGYDKAVVQTLYIPLGLTILTLAASLSMEWRSVKKKQS